MPARRPVQSADQVLHRICQHTRHECQDPGTDRVGSGRRATNGADLSLWLKRVKDQALSTILAGGEIPGYKVVEGRGSRTWADELEVAAWLSKQGYSQEEYTKTEVLSVAQMEKALGKKKVADLLNGHILKKTGAPTVVPASDKRPAYDPAADFNNLEE